MTHEKTSILRKHLGNALVKFQKEAMGSHATKSHRVATSI